MELSIIVMQLSKMPSESHPRSHQPAFRLLTLFRNRCVKQCVLARINAVTPSIIQLLNIMWLFCYKVFFRRVFLFIEWFGIDGKYFDSTVNFHITLKRGKRQGDSSSANTFPIFLIKGRLIIHAKDWCQREIGCAKINYAE